MADFVGTPTFWRIALWVDIETVHLKIARISLFCCGQLFDGKPWVPMNNLTSMKTCPEVARYITLDPRIPVRRYYMPVFSDSSSYFVFFFHPRKYYFFTVYF